MKEVAQIIGVYYFCTEVGRIYPDFSEPANQLLFMTKHHLGLNPFAPIRNKDDYENAQGVMDVLIDLHDLYHTKVAPALADLGIFWHTSHRGVVIKYIKGNTPYFGGFTTDHPLSHRVKIMLGYLPKEVLN